MAKFTNLECAMKGSKGLDVRGGKWGGSKAAEKLSPGAKKVTSGSGPVKA